METNNNIVIQWRKQKVTSTRRCKIHKSIKNTVINYTYRSERIIEVKINIGRVKLSFFWTLRPTIRNNGRKR